MQLVFDGNHPTDYYYYRVPIPWLQIKLLRLLQHYPPSASATVRKALDEVLSQILDNSRETPKNVQHSNTQHAILFEAINLAIHVNPDSDVVRSSAVLLGRFILSKETNVRYLGLDAMAHLAACSDSLEPVRKHQQTIILSLRDRDISVRRRALDLLYSMCDGSNARTIVDELLKYLVVADYGLREEMVLKIAILTEKWAMEYEWYVDTSKSAWSLHPREACSKPLTTRPHCCRPSPQAHQSRWRPCRRRGLVPRRSDRHQHRRPPGLCLAHLPRLPPGPVGAREARQASGLHPRRVWPPHRQRARRGADRPVQRASLQDQLLLGFDAGPAPEHLRQVVRPLLLEPSP